ncbi:MAG TPA: DUF1254 domain-containing protein [Hyphomicrobiaceae bacterium]|nr:DUF1254 domain-containing protein [Hyphomicrobiaceae bacterium]
MSVWLPKWTRATSWRLAIGAALLGGIIHILTVLAVPVMGRSNALQVLRGSLPANEMVMVPPWPEGAKPLPFLGAGALYAICRYDLTGGPVEISAALIDAGWTLSLHAPAGDNFYVVPAQEGRTSEVSFVLVPPADQGGDFTTPARASNDDTTQLASPTLEGLVVVRAPLKGVAWRSQTEAVLRRAQCTPLRP